MLDLRDEPIIVDTYEGSSPSDPPELEQLLESIDEFRDAFIFDCELVEC